MLLLLAAPLAYNLAVSPLHAARARPVLMASWASIDGGTREATVETLNELKAEGSASLWNTMRIAPRPVTLRELCQVSTEARTRD